MDLDERHYCPESGCLYCMVMHLYQIISDKSHIIQSLTMTNHKLRQQFNKEKDMFNALFAALGNVKALGAIQHIESLFANVLSGVESEAKTIAVNAFCAILQNQATLPVVTTAPSNVVPINPAQ